MEAFLALITPAEIVPFCARFFPLILSAAANQE
jgi:hypothetical protein